ncbi:transcriptional repressor [Streptomyces sp. NPDC055962]|uniref:transcriptional repressor n=1 Tax=unclassified Streptomyces TaxID=2593676 RepID=UPI0035DCA09A
MIEAETRTLLRGASLRVTRCRVTALPAVHAAPPADVRTRLIRVHTRIGAVPARAVQDVLTTLVDAGPARRIDLSNSPARHEARSPDEGQSPAATGRAPQGPEPVHGSLHTEEQNHF